VDIFSPLKQGNYQCTTGEQIQIDKEYIDKVFKDRVREFGEKNKLRDKISFFLRKDNVLVPIEYSMTSLFGNSGESIGAFAVIRDITERKKTEEKLFKYQEQLKALASQIALTEEQERRRFAGFLHDEIGQQLFATQIQLGYLKGSLSSVQNVQQVDDAIDNIKKVMTSSRSLTAELSPPVLYELGLEKALEWLAEQAHEKYDIVVTFKDDKKEKLLDDDVKIILYQTVRELLINVAKHAQTKKASVSIKKDDSSVRICVEDNGIGFDSSSKDYFDN
jgi:signal transduction histidine kinase